MKNMRMKKIKKFFGFSAALVSTVALVGCGGDHKSSVNAGTQQQGIYPGTNYPYPYPSGVPVQQTFSCAQGQLQLNGQCFQTQDLAQACQWASGQLIQTQSGVLCKSERDLGNLVQARIIAIGNYRRDFQISPNLRLGEILKIDGSVDPNNSSNPWQLQALQGGAVVGSTSSDQVVSDGSGNVEIYAYNYYGQNQQNVSYPNVNPNTNPQGQYLPINANIGIQGMWGMNNGWMNGMIGMPTPYILRLTARGSVHVSLYGTAIACENGNGNLYPCM